MKKRAKISVSGKVIKEHSELVPSTKFAIIELIKNAYEAKASKVDIMVNDTVMSITDDGVGMNEDEIKSLLVLSKSEKKFGAVINGRLISGEKGLGFYSVFKFGQQVNVETIKDGKIHIFDLDMEKISNFDDISEYDVEINILDAVDKKAHGTKLKITNFNSESINLFKTTLDNSSEFAKIQKAILDDEFKISINRNWTGADSKEYKKYDLSSKIISMVSFDSKKMYDKQENKFYFEQSIGNEKTSYDLSGNYLPLLLNKNVHIIIELIIYKFSSGDLKKVEALFKDRNETKIAPLLYINNAYFDNQEFYNVGIHSSKRTGSMFRQQVGFLKLNIYSPNIINFNSDRTMMIESQNVHQLKLLFDDISSGLQNNIKNTSEREKENVPKKVIQYLFERQELSTLNDKFDNNDIYNIKFNDQLVKQFDSDRIGKWVFLLKNKDEYTVIVREYGLATMRLTTSYLEAGKEYSMDDFIIAQDCLGTQKIAINSIEVTPKNIVNYDSNRQVLVAGTTGNIRIKIKYKDKVSDRQFNFNEIIEVKRPKTTVTEIKTPFFGMVSNIESKTYEDLKELISEMNNVYKANKTSKMFICSIRTLLELISCDILDALKQEKSTYLSDNIKKIFKDESVKKNFIDHLIDERERKGLETIHNSFVAEATSTKLTQSFNMTTHGASRFLKIENIEHYFPLINLLYSYLLWLNKE